MITYYPDGSWDTEHGGGAPEFTSEEINRMWQELRTKDISDDVRRTIVDLCDFMTETEEADGEEYYNDTCDCDCRNCTYKDDCYEEYSDPCNDEDEEDEDTKHYSKPAKEPALTCERCECKYCTGLDACSYEYNDPCDDEEEEDEEDQYDDPAEKATTVEPAFTCERCEYYCAGFTCPMNIKKKKGCGM